MITVLLAALLAGSPPCPPAESDITWTLVAQAVDQLWLPLPDASVVITSKGEDGRTWRGVTNKRGFACFALSNPGEHSLKIERNGFYSGDLSILDVYASAYGAQYVQLKMDVMVIDQGRSTSPRAER